MLCLLRLLGRRAGESPKPMVQPPPTTRRLRELGRLDSLDGLGDASLSG